MYSTASYHEKKNEVADKYRYEAKREITSESTGFYVVPMEKDVVLSLMPFRFVSKLYSSIVTANRWSGLRHCTLRGYLAGCRTTSGSDLFHQ